MMQQYGKLVSVMKLKSKDCKSKLITGQFAAFNLV